MTAIGRSISAGLLFFGIAGCGRSFPFVGTWRAYRPIEERAGVDSDILRQVAKIQVTVFDDGRYELYINGLMAKGSTTHRGEELLLTPHEVLDRPIEQQPPEIRKAIPEARLVPGKDGTVTFNAPGQPSLVLQRIATTPVGRP